MTNGARPLPIYLDTADWAYLQEGKASDAEASLRRLGADGKAVFLISEDHLMEIAGLSHGREERLEFMRSFPGTIRFPYSTHDVLRHNAWELVEIVEGREIMPTSIPARPLSDATWEELLEELDDLAMIRDSYYFGAEILDEARSTDGKQTASDVRAEAKMLHAFGTGSPAKITQQLMRMGKALPQDSGMVEQRIAMAMEALQSGGLMGLTEWIAEQMRVGGHEMPDGQIQMLEQAVEDVQWDPALLLLDRVFQWTVLPYLPDEVRHDRERLAAVAKGWRRAEIRSRVPGLAAYGALVKAIHFEPQRKLEGSEMIDRRHAVYSPMVVMFTCDKRNEGPLRNMFSEFEASAPIIVRTKRLADIATVLLSTLEAPG